jgi:hypothetical protein
MKKVLFGLAALTGAAIVSNSADAIRLQFKENKIPFADFGVKTQIYAQSLDKAANNNGDRATDFAIQNARIYFRVYLNPAVKFITNFDFSVTGSRTSHESTSTTKVRDAFVNINLNTLLQGTELGKSLNKFLQGTNEGKQKEQQLSFIINVMAGYNRVPFSRETLTPRYTRIFMPQDGWLNYNPNGGVYKDQILTTLYIARTNAAVHLTSENVMGAPTLGNAVAMTGTTDEADYSRDAGLTFWGTAGSYVTYYFGIYDSFGDHNAGEVVANNGKDNLGYIVRLQVNLMPILAQTGIVPNSKRVKPEGEYYYLQETYLGKQDVATLGLSYAQTKLDLVNNGSYTFKSWNIDFNIEQGFHKNTIVPKFAVAYAQTDSDNLPLATKPRGNTYTRLDKVKTFQLKLGVLYNQKVGL